MQHNIYIYILVMFAVTYLIRVLPLTLIRREIKNKTIRSFLYYVPYVTLAVMTFPAIMEATNSPVAGLAALVVGIILAWFGRSLFQVAVPVSYTHLHRHKRQIVFYQIFQFHCCDIIISPICAFYLLLKAVFNLLPAE